MNYIQPTHKYYRFFESTQQSGDIDSISEKLRTITGLVATDYIPTVTQEGGDICTLISDESEYKGHVCVGVVLLPFLHSDALNYYENALQNLVDRIGISRIHFSEIFGRNGLTGENRKIFLEEYPKIVSQIPMSCLSISREKNLLISSWKNGNKINEEIFHSLFWNNFWRILPALKPFSILHIYREVENNFTQESAIRESDKLLSGIQQLSPRTAGAPSICRHPHIFTKKALLYSSLSDLVAYSSNVLQQKTDAGVPRAKISIRNREMLNLLKRTFTNFSGLEGKLSDLVRAS